MLAVIAGLSSILLYWVIKEYPNWLIEICIGLAVAFIVLMLNPKRRYYKAFWSSLTLLGTLTMIPVFQFRAEIENSNTAGIEHGNIELITADIHWSIFLILGLIAIVALVLDYYERQERKPSSKREKRTSNINQHHSGSGDNVAGNKVINN